VTPNRPTREQIIELARTDPEALAEKTKSNPMPTVFTLDGYRFFFNRNDHTPIHVHMQYGGGEAVFDVEGEVVLRESVGLKTKELSKAEALASEHRELITRKWHEHSN
jgi:hypothetical protein